jgi:hypothetical protein
MTTLIDLTKKAAISLEKKELTNVTAQIVAVFDISASMRNMYSTGKVQEVANRLLALGMNMDDNKEIEVYAFGKDAHYIGNATEKNHIGFVKDVLLKKVSYENSTHYAGVMQKIVGDFGVAKVAEKQQKEIVQPPAPKKKGFFARLFGGAEETPVVQVKEKIEEIEAVKEVKKIPTFVFFITDGDNYDKSLTEEVIKNCADQAIFWQFVGIGNSNFEFLEKLDEMDGRFIDNANFFQLDDISSISDERLYDRLLNEFPSWLKEAKAKGVLAA